MLFKQTPETREIDRPWQEDFEQLQKSFQEVLQTISRLSGVELPGGATDLQDPGNPDAQLDSKTLKDRIRNDLESFAATTASEIARQTERQTRIALAAIQSEANVRAEQVTRELRERMQGQFEPGHFELGITQQTQDRISELVRRRTDEFARWVWLTCKGTGTPIPVQVEKLLEPYVEEATGKFTESFRQQFNNQIAEQEQLAQHWLQGTVGSIQEQISSLEVSAQSICDRKVESVSKSSEDRLHGVADEAAKNFGNRIQEQVESGMGAFRASLEQAMNAMREKMRQEQDQNVGTLVSRVAEMQSEVKEQMMSQISGRIEQTAVNVIESSVQHLHQQAHDTVDHSKAELRGFLDLQMEEARTKLNDLGQSVRESLSKDAERKIDSVRRLDEEIALIRDKGIAAANDQISAMVQEALVSMRERITQASGAQLEETDRLVRESQEKAALQYEAQLRGITDTWNNNLLEQIQIEAGKAGARVSAEVKVNSESVMQELSDKVDASALVLREKTSEATAKIEALLESSLANYRQQLSQIAEARVEEHRKAILSSLTDLQGRLERSAQVLRQEIIGNLEPEM